MGSVMRSQVSPVVIISFLSFILLATPNPVTARSYSTQDYAAIGASNDTYAAAINNAGQLSGACRSSSREKIGSWHACIILGFGLDVNLQAISKDPNIERSSITDSNNNNQFVGTALVRTMNKDTVARAFVATQSTWQYLPPVFGETEESAAVGLNDSGMVTGNVLNGGIARGFVWDPKANPPMKLLGLPSNAIESHANAINRKGVVVGYAAFSKYGPKPSISFAQKNSYTTYLLPAPFNVKDRCASFTGTATTINDNEAAGGLVCTSPSGKSENHIVIWSITNKGIAIARSLGTIPPGEYVVHLNHKQQVLVASSDHVYLYDSTLAPREFLQVKRGRDLTFLQSFTDLNDRGQLAGYGFYERGMTAFLGQINSDDKPTSGATLLGNGPDLLDQLATLTGMSRSELRDLIGDFANGLDDFLSLIDSNPMGSEIQMGQNPTALASINFGGGAFIALRDDGTVAGGGTGTIGNTTVGGGFTTSGERAVSAGGMLITHSEGMRMFGARASDTRTEGERAVDHAIENRRERDTQEQQTATTSSTTATTSTPSTTTQSTQGPQLREVQLGDSHQHTQPSLGVPQLPPPISQPAEEQMVYVPPTRFQWQVLNVDFAALRAIAIGHAVIVQPGPDWGTGASASSSTSDSNSPPPRIGYNGTNDALSRMLEVLRTHIVQTSANRVIEMERPRILEP